MYSRRHRTDFTVINRAAADVSEGLPLRTPGGIQATVSAGAEAYTEVTSTTVDGSPAAIEPSRARGHMGARAWSTGGVVYTEATEAHPTATHGLHINNERAFAEVEAPEG